MKKTIMLIISIVLLLQGCNTYSPVVDTGGRSKFEKSNASQISDDLLHCKDLAKSNSTMMQNFTFWLVSPKAETKFKYIYRTCMLGRNHQVLD